MKIYLKSFLILFYSVLALHAINAIFAGSNETYYQLSPFDLVDVSVYGEDDLATEQRISDNGELSIPLLGNVKVGGLTVSAAAKLIEKSFIEAEYLRKPVVTISIKEFAPKTVTVMGQVEKPGSIEISPGRNGIPLPVAIAEAGGFTGTAKTTEVRITRGGGASGAESNFIIVNAAKLLESTSKVEERDVFIVYPDDIVFVPRRVF